MSGSRVLIVNADDFGRSPGINEGIIQAHREGIVTSTTLMVNTRWAADAVTAAAAWPDLGIGLHFNVCYGSPVSRPGEIPSLVDESGRFETSTATVTRRADPSDVEIELTAQLGQFRDLLGREPTHIDSHKYVHSADRIAPVVGAVAARFGLPVRATSETDRTVLRELGAATPDHFEGRFHGLDGDGVSLEILLAALESVGPGITEMMCHPGIVDEYLLDSSYRDDRKRELDILCSVIARQVTEAREIRLATFGALREG